MNIAFFRFLLPGLILITGLSNDCFSDEIKPKASALKTKVDQMIIDKIVFEDAGIKAAINYLSSKSKEIDPEKKGVNIILQLNLKKDEKIPEITLHLTEVSMHAAIGYICLLSNLKYRIGDSTVIIGRDIDTLETKTFAVKPDLSASIKAAEPDDVKKYFYGKGISPVEKDSFAYEKNGKLLVKTTQENLRKVEKLLGYTEPTPSNLKLSGKLRQIKFDSIEFEDVSFQSIIKYITERARNIDPEKKGVNIVLDLNAEQLSKLPSLTINISDIQLDTVIEYICKLSNLKYKVEEYAVVIYSDAEQKARKQ